MDKPASNGQRLPQRLLGRRILLCGASGFIGSALWRRLTRAGVEVHGISRTARVTEAGNRWWQGDLTEPMVAARILQEIRPDIIYNLSGISDARPARDRVLPTFFGNALSTINLLLATADVGCERFI